MTSRLRLVLLVLVLAWVSVAGTGAASGARRSHETPWFAPRIRDLGRFRTHPVKRPAPARAPSLGLGDRAARYARRLLGVPYRWGGDSPSSGFDCSGLVRYVFGHFGLRLPHSSYADFGLGRRVPRGALRPGDLVFFDGLGHVGLYVGSGRFIHAPHSGATVRIARLDDPWYRATFAGARRIVRTLSRS